MKQILNFTEDRGNNGYRAAINAVVVRVETDADNINKLILNEINLGQLTKQLKKGKTVEAATATLIWRAVRTIIKANKKSDGILLPTEVPEFVYNKLERKLSKQGMSVYKVSDIR